MDPTTQSSTGGVLVPPAAIEEARSRPSIGKKLQLDQWTVAHKGEAKAKKPATKAAAPASKPATGAEASSSDDRLAKLKDLASLKEAGVLTEEEFQAEKKRILEGN